MDRSVYKDPRFPHEQRAADLVSQMTRVEKLSQLVHDSPAIPRLGIPAYNWWNECLHGVARAGIATVFPQAIGLAACFNPRLMHRIAYVISGEARAIYNRDKKKETSGQYHGLTFWTPNINIFRDPRWGRGQETYGECPFLTSRLAVEFIKGLQGNDRRYMKVAACAKHFAAHSGPETQRHHFNAKVSLKDLHETYLPAFEAAVKEAAVEAIMGAYNRVNNEPACASKYLLKEVLRDRWGFAGHVVSDCEAIEDIYKNHKAAATYEEALALALNTGCDLNCCNEICSGARPAYMKADALGLLKEEAIDRAVTKLFTTRFKLGMFDPPSMIRYNRIKPAIIKSYGHARLALEAARESIVLLKNKAVLPLPPAAKIAVIGPHADSVKVLLGNYYGEPASPVTFLAGIKKAFRNSYYAGTIADTVKADYVVAAIGMSPDKEGEECDTGGFERRDLSLPPGHEELLMGLYNAGKKVIAIVTGGGAISFDNALCRAIIHVWYPGQAGGTAVADILSGKANPSGRLPVTFYSDIAQLPAYEDYSMEGRTYRYFEGRPLYPFGYGLSYTKFAYTGLKIRRSIGGKHVVLKVTVTNTGARAGMEAVQVYFRDLKATVRVPRLQLAGMKKIRLLPGQAKRVDFRISLDQLSITLENGRRVFEPGLFRFWAGGVQPGCEKLAASCTGTVTDTIEVGGKEQ